MEESNISTEPTIRTGNEEQAIAPIQEVKKRGRKKGSKNKAKFEAVREEMDLNNFTESAATVTAVANEEKVITKTEEEKQEDMKNFTETLDKTISQIKIPIPINTEAPLGKNNFYQEIKDTPLNNDNLFTSTFSVKKGNITVEPDIAKPNTQVLPPNNWMRNAYGLLNHVNYIFNEDSSVDYRRLVKKEFFVPNKSKTQEKDVTKLEDKDLLILLAGIKEVAQIRGYTSVDHQVISANHDSVFVKTTICWLPNYETNMQPVCFSALADATLANTQSFAKNYLMSIAENRGFVRAVRNFLRIHVLGADEIGPQEKFDDSKLESASPASPHSVLGNLLKTNNITFEKFQEGMIKKAVEGAKDWQNIQSIPKSQIFDLINKVNEALEAKKNKTAIKE